MAVVVELSEAFATGRTQPDPQPRGSLARGGAVPRFSRGSAIKYGSHVHETMLIVCLL